MVPRGGQQQIAKNPVLISDSESDDPFDLKCSDDSGDESDGSIEIMGEQVTFKKSPMSLPEVRRPVATAYTVFRANLLFWFPNSEIDEKDIKMNFEEELKKPNALRKWEEKARDKNNEQLHGAMKRSRKK